MAGLRSLLAWWMGGSGKAEQKLEDQLSPFVGIADMELSCSSFDAPIDGSVASQELSFSAADSPLAISYIEAI